MYIFWGKVIQGKKRGKGLGFPTANLRLHKTIPVGVYVSRTKFEKKWFNSISFIGPAKTFGASEIFAETHILDFNRNLYAKWVSFKLLKKIRGSQKFVSKKQLIERMEKDKKEAILYFKIH